MERDLERGREEGTLKDTLGVRDIARVEQRAKQNIM